MNEEQNLELMIEVAKEVAKESYEDGVKPVLKPTGQLLGMLPRAIKAALLPCEKWILDKEYNLAETKKLLETKLANVNPENIVPPEAYIAVPALQYISYCMDNEELRDMYANLLASSMNKVVKNGVHPGFVEIIKQLSPDEVKILKYISKEKAIPTITLRANKENGSGIAVISNFSNVGELVKCEEAFEIDRYFDNLIRLGLIEKAAYSSVLVKDELYTPLEEHEYIQNTIERLKSLKTEYTKPKLQRSYMTITSFGEQFCDICLTK
ncbi:MAG: DUF4393 domain-containing protein [Clostridia bacterium]|nr:DUF4393 domain-containing protein [Clostridia bacterium]